MDRKVLLIYTSNYKQWPHLPNSVLALAGPLINSGFEVEILDTAIEDYKDRSYNQYFLVGISVLSDTSIALGLSISAFIRKNSPLVKIVWGGAHPTALTDQTIRSTLVDFVVRGHGEETIVELARELSDTQQYGKIKGLSYKEDGKILHNSEREPADMDRIGLYLYHLLNIEKYPSMHEKFSYNSSRGCPYQCTFCSYEKRWVARSSKKVVDDLEKIIDLYHPEVIRMSEAEFFVSQKRVEEICHGLINRKIKIKWEANCRVNYFVQYSDDFIRLLIESGCYNLGFGGESGSNRVLEQINKKITREQIFEVAERIKGFNIEEVRFSFMCGLPGETEDDLAQTLSLIQEIWRINPAIYINGLFIYMPYPGSELYREAQKRFGLNPPQTLEEWGELRGLIEHSNRMTPWISKKWRRKLETLSGMVRFHYFCQYFQRMSEKQRLSWFFGSRILVFFFALMNWFYRVSERTRWKYNWFNLAIEWRIWTFLRDRFLGQH